ncbi:hypothetical protein NPIL_207651 [Nephila pilipes]|uniref:Uncharacterized protein n=1 Tax=Nephila pilipes TaxID=299642 RepID=A0A8X6MYG0_NEPPI|nr:hypothetical protein NPIL_207651 [Nephila pilipes]
MLNISQNIKQINLLQYQVDPISIAFMNFSRKRKCLKKTFKKSVLPSEEAYVTFIAAIKTLNRGGGNQEAVANEQFLNYLSKQPVSGMLMLYGLMINKENIFLETPQDGLIVCNCSEMARVEIICPARGKELAMDHIPIVENTKQL